MPRRQCMRRSPSSNEPGERCTLCEGPVDIPRPRLSQRWRRRSFGNDCFHVLLLPSKRRLPRQPTLSHLKGSELFETLACESEASLRAFQTGRIDFLFFLGLPGFLPEEAWIEAVRIRVFPAAALPSKGSQGPGILQNGAPRAPIWLPNSRIRFCAGGWPSGARHTRRASRRHANLRWRRQGRRTLPGAGPRACSGSTAPSEA